LGQQEILGSAPRSSASIREEGEFAGSTARDEAKNPSEAQIMADQRGREKIHKLFLKTGNFFLFFAFIRVDPR